MDRTTRFWWTKIIGTLKDTMFPRNDGPDLICMLEEQLLFRNYMFDMFSRSKMAQGSARTDVQQAPPCGDGGGEPLHDGDPVHDPDRLRAVHRGR